MSLLPEIDPLELQPDETVTAEWFADHVQGGQPVRGRLILTNQRVAFQPTKMGIVMQGVALLGGSTLPSGEPWSCELKLVTAVNEAPPVKRPPEAESKPVALVLRDGPEQAFLIVRDFDGSVEKIRSAVG